MKQKTINKIITFNGIGLHSGLNIKIKLLPTKKGGIIFKDIKNNKIKATYDNVIDTQLGTSIGNKNINVKTIEHLMAALYYCNIDNVVIKIIDGQEIPIMDGSSKIFVEKIKKAGIFNLKSERKFLKIKKNIEFIENGSFIKAYPDENYCVDLTVNFPYGHIGEQKLYWDGENNNLINARTFCNKNEIEYMHSIGLVKGGSLNNAIVFDDNGIVNKDGFKIPNEVVSHKMLDLIGDFFTSGYRIKGKFICNKTGHSLNNKFLKKVFENKNNYTISK